MSPTNFACLIGVQFWVWPDIYDVLTVVGLLVSLIALYFAWRDIRRRVLEAKNAAKQAVARVAKLLLQNDVSEAIRSIREAREACRLRNWTRAIFRCEEVKHRVAAFQNQGVINPEEQPKLAEAIDDLGMLIRHLERKTDADLMDKWKIKLDDLASHLSAIEGRLRFVELEINDV